MSEAPAPLEPYEIRPITKKDKPLVLRFLRAVFYEEEPLNESMYRNQTEDVRYRDRGLYAVSCVDESLSLMIVTPSKQIVAIVLNENVHHGPEDTSGILSETNPFFPIIRKIVVMVDEQVDMVAGLTNSDDKEMCLKIMCIHPNWRNKGLGKLLLEQTRDIAKQNGFCQIRSTCTSAFSAKMFANFGYQCVYALNYEDYKENGKVVFKPAEPHTAVRAMILKI